MIIYKHFEQTTTMQPKILLPKLLPWLMSATLVAFVPVIMIAGPFSSDLLMDDWWVVDAGADQNICVGDSAQLLATGANTYTWSPATGLSCSLCPDPKASPSVTTTYFVMGDDGTVDSVTISIIAEPQIQSVNAGDPTDCNLPNGTIVIDAQGSEPLEYSINGGMFWQGNAFFTALPSGNYAIMVRYVSGSCEVQGPSITLQAPTAPEILNVSGSDPTLCDTPNGAIIISTAGGIPPLQYSNNGGLTWQGSNTFQLLTSGNYDVRVRNSDGSCEISGGVISLSGSPR